MTMFNITDGNNNISRDKPVEHIDMVIGLHVSACTSCTRTMRFRPCFRRDIAIDITESVQLFVCFPYAAVRNITLAKTEDLSRLSPSPESFSRRAQRARPAVPNPAAAMEALGEPLLDAKPKGDEKTAVAKRKLLIGAGLCTAFMLTEIFGGVVCGSLAIITDAAHMLSDVAG